MSLRRLQAWNKVVNLEMIKRSKSKESGIRTLCPVSGMLPALGEHLHRNQDVGAAGIIAGHISQEALLLSHWWRHASLLLACSSSISQRWGQGRGTVDDVISTTWPVTGLLGLQFLHLKMYIYWLWYWLESTNMTYSWHYRPSSSGVVGAKMVSKARKTVSNVSHVVHISLRQRAEHEASPAAEPSVSLSSRSMLTDLDQNIVLHWSYVTHPDVLWCFTHTNMRHYLRFYE